MSTVKIDQFMEKLGEKLEPGFSVNQDRDLTDEIMISVLKKAANTFTGTHRYDTRQMLCTGNAYKETDSFTVLKDGIVYGPYVRMNPGRYLVSYCFNAVGDDTIHLEISSGGTVFAAADVSGGDSKTLELALSEKAEHLEFKLINTGKAAITFYSVEVSLITPPKIDRHIPEATSPRPEAAIAVGVPLHLQPLSVSDELSNEIAELDDLGRCELPPDAPFRFSKKIVRRLIGCFSRLQTNFNAHLVLVVSRLNNKVNRHILLANDNQEAQSQQIEELYRRLDQAAQSFGRLELLEEQLRKEAEKNEGLERSIGALTERSDTTTGQLTALSNLLTVCTERLDRQRSETDGLRLAKEKAETEIKNAMFDISKEISEIRNGVARIKEDFDGVSRGQQREISSLWEKIVRIDREFESIWNTDKRFNDEFGSIWKQYSSLRGELFYELDYRMRAAGAETVSGTGMECPAPVVRESARAVTERNNGAIRLNLGCGHIPLDGYINVDIRDIPGVDVVASAAALPFEENSVDEIFSAHLIEHFEFNVMQRELMPYWYGLLRPGGIMRIVFPDSEQMISAYNNGEMSFDELSLVIMGAQDYDKDYHYTMYNVEKVEALLCSAGFENVTLAAEGRINGGCRESEVFARKPKKQTGS